MRRRERGVSIVMAIFLIVAIAALAAAAVSVGRATSDSTNGLLLRDRTEAAAEAGLEWAIYRLRVQSIPCTTVNGQQLALGLGALRGFTVTVSCLRATNQNVFDVTAFAQQGIYGRPDYASRTLTRRID